MNNHKVPFVFVGNNLAIDFINTEIVSHGELIDLLEDSADLERWVKAAELNVQMPLSRADFVEARLLRKTLKDLYTAVIDNQPAAEQAVVTLNEHLKNHSTHQVLQYNKRGNKFTMATTSTPLTTPMLLAHLAHEGALLLASTKAPRLKHCGNTDCVLIFLDTSRSQQRRWCSMETCGNRAKVAKHYRNSMSQQ